MKANKETENEKKIVTRWKRNFQEDMTPLEAAYIAVAYANRGCSLEQLEFYDIIKRHFVKVDIDTVKTRPASKD